MKRSAIQLHMVPNDISSLEVGLPDLIYATAKSVTLLEADDVQNEGQYCNRLKHSDFAKQYAWWE